MSDSMLTEIDHVAIAVKDLDAAVAYYQDTFGCEVAHREVVERDGVEEVLLKVADSYVQLLTPIRDDSPVAKYLEKKGEGIHHVGYRVDDCAAALERVKAAGHQVIDDVPRPGSRGTTVAFVHPKTAYGTLIELVQEWGGPGGIGRDPAKFPSSHGPNLPITSRNRVESHERCSTGRRSPMSTSSRKRRWIAGFALVPVAALVVSACAPKPAPVPAPAQTSVKASATGSADREYWGVGEEVGDKNRVTTTTAPPAPACSGATHQTAIEQCHLTYRAYQVDTTSNAAQATADFIAARISPAQCQNGTLNSYHSGNSLNPGATVIAKYPGAQFASENLFCMFFTPSGCASIQLGATNALNAWKASPGHKANMDSIVSRWVNGGGACFTSPYGHSVYVAVAQFRYP